MREDDFMFESNSDEERQKKILHAQLFYLHMRYGIPIAEPEED